MKIAIVGSHGVGKTTLTKVLSKKLNFNYIHDIVRYEAFKKGFVINESTPSEVQLWLTMRQWELEKITPENWIADKSLLDYLVYGQVVLKEKAYKQIIHTVVKSNIKYDFVFYLPIEFPMKMDGIRSEDKNFQRRIDIIYKNLLHDLGIKYILLSGSVDERVVKATEHIGNFNL